jgi:PAS domain S-box-containing protein
VHQIEIEMQNEDLRRAHIELEASRTRYFDLYDLAPVGYVSLNGKGIILEANLTIAAFLGKERSILIRQPLSRFIISEDQGIYYDHLKRLFETREQQACEVRMIKEDGTRIWARVESVAAKERVDMPASLTAIIDIAGRKQAQEELDLYRKHLEVMVGERTSELTAANEELEAFNYSVSHDLLAPLRHISAFAQMLQQRLINHPDEKARRYVDIITSASIKAGSLVSDLLNFSRLGRAEMQKKRINLHSLVNEVVSEIPEELKDRKIRWEIGNLPEVLGDEALLKLVIFNLVSNAVKFTRSCSEADITIACMDEGDKFTCSIADNGAGFDMKYAGKLFGVFQRLHPQDEFEGTGIGLANAQRIINRHGGRMWAEGAVGKGATFYFTLPKPGQLSE